MRTKKSALIFAIIAVFWLSTMQVYAQDNMYAIHIEFAANNKTKPIEGVGFKAVRFMDINYHALDGWKEKDVSYEKIFDDPQSSALELKEIEEKQSSKSPIWLLSHLSNRSKWWRSGVSALSSGHCRHTVYGRR